MCNILKTHDILWRHDQPDLPVVGNLNYPVLDDLMDKLKLLSFEKQLLKEMKLKAPNRNYFEKARNPGEQFFLFTSICSWLLRKLGKAFEQPQEFDDPNILISKIIQHLKDLVRNEFKCSTQ